MNFIFLGALLAAITIFNIIVPAFGSSTVTPMMAGFVGAKNAIAVATVYYCISNIPRVYAFREYTDWKLIRQLLPASLLGALIGSTVLVGVNPHIVAIVVLAFLLYFIAKKVHAMFGVNAAKKTKED